MSRIAILKENAFQKETLFGTLILGSFVFGFYKLMILSAKKHASKKLQLSFKNLRVKKVTLNDGITFDVFFNASNPTGTELTFSQPYVQILIPDNKGVMSPIAISDNAKETVTLKGQETSVIPVSLQITPVQALKLPNLIKYLWNRYLIKLGSFIIDGSINKRLRESAEGLSKA